EEITGFSVLALTVDHALRAHDVDRFRRQLFDTIHRDHLELEREDLLGMAAKAGLDVDEFLANQRRWLKEVAEEHREAERRWGAFGTPTLVFDDRDAVYLELSAVPESEQEAIEMWNSVVEVARDRPKLREVRRTVS
ncbi:MAG: DsbA family protein, partial [Actinomycetota bacterium]